MLERIIDWFLNYPEKRKLFLILFLLVALPLMILAAITVQNLRQRASAPVEILHQSGNPISRTTDTEIKVKISLPSDWVLPPEALGKNDSSFVSKAYAQSACQSSCGACPTKQTYGTTTYDTCTDNLQQGGGALCSNGATSFECHAQENPNCSSGGLVYSCPPSQQTCQTSCGACPTTVTHGATTYDTCSDNFGQSGSNLCKNGATAFECHARENPNCSSGGFVYSCPPPSPTPTSALPTTRPPSGGGGGGGGGFAPPPQPTATPTPIENATPTAIPPTPTPTPHVLREIYIENKDTDGSSGGSEPLRVTSNFAQAFLNPVAWKLNALKDGQNEASRIVQVTFFDGANFVPYAATVTLVRPTETTGLLSDIELFVACTTDNIPVGTTCNASALGYDATKVPLFENITYEWGVSSSGSIGTLSQTQGNITGFTAQNVGFADIWIVARQNDRQARKSIRVQVVPAPEPPPGTGISVPSPTPSPTPTPTTVQLPTATPTQAPVPPTSTPTPTPIPAGVLLYRLSFDQNFTNILDQGDFGTINERIITLTLPGGPGPKTVHIQFFENGVWGPTPPQAVTIQLR